MAIIANQVPPPGQLPVDFKRRVVIKFRSDVQLSYSIAAAGELARLVEREWSNLNETFRGITLTPYFSTIEGSTLQDLMRRSPRVKGGALPPNFALYYAIECPPNVEPEHVARTIATWSIVEIAYVEGGPAPPPLNPSNNPRSANQGYLDAAPAAIDARWAWGSVDGSGVGFVDLEQGWTLNHEDLAMANIAIISGVNKAYPGHGTAVLGEVVAVDNYLGGIGIAPRATARVVSQWRTASTYNTAEAILSAVGAMSVGDVLLLEAQTGTPFMPVEVELERYPFKLVRTRPP